MKAFNSRISITIIFLMILYSFSGCTELITNFELAGEKDPVTIAKSTHSILILDVTVGVGSINLESASNATYLVDVVNRVSIREGSDGTLAEAEEVTSTEIDSDTMKIEFDSNDEGIRVDYKYDLWIKVGSDISLQINFVDSTGDIDVELADSSLTLSSFDLHSSTGSITVILTDLLFSDSSPIVHLSTGDLDLTLTNIRYASSTTWSTSTSTGDIDLDYTDNLPFSNVTTIHQFEVTCSTGSINVLSRLDQSIGLKIVTSISTGSVTIPGGSSAYTSTNFDSSAVKYDFTLSVSTGDITFISSG